jgi:hypothetical protein
MPFRVKGTLHYYTIQVICQGCLRGAKPLFLIPSPSSSGEGDKGGEVDRLKLLANAFFPTHPPIEAWLLNNFINALSF